MLIPYFSPKSVNLNHLKFHFFRFVYMASNNLHSEVADSERFSSPAVQFLHRALEVLLMCGTSDPICFILDEIPRWWWLDFDF
jgi:hypothetical protein